MVQRNRRLSVPRYAPLSPGGISRTPFLNGEVLTYLGPDQDLWAMPEVWAYPPLVDLGGHTYSGGMLTTLPYVPPGDWSPSGNLLRVPQVVHFSVIGDFGDPQFVALFAACTTVVDRLRTLRRGKTWGKAIDWFDYTHVHGGAFAVYFTDGRWLHLLAPPAGLPRFFGPNYLHLYIGAPLFLLLQDPADITTEAVIGVESFNDVGSGLYNLNRAKVTSNHDSFAGYTCKLYGVGETIPDSFLQRTASDLAFYGFSFEGTRDLLRDAATILGVVAAHFGFDPATGRDLARP